MKNTEPIRVLVVDGDPGFADLTAACLEREDDRFTVETATDRTVDADPQRLKQLLENLLRNAVERGGPDVTVTVGRLDASFCVADDGPGIPPAEREQVFEMGHSTADQGTGFGLAIVQQVASAHGWEVTITESSRGGTRFEITF